MDQKFAVLSQGPHYVPEKGYNTVKQARDDGALVLAWGYDSRPVSIKFRANLIIGDLSKIC